MPSAAGVFTADTFLFSTPGGSAARLSCVGNAGGPSLAISEHTAFFGDVKLGSDAVKEIVLSNSACSQLHSLNRGLIVNSLTCRLGLRGRL